MSRFILSSKEPQNVLIPIQIGQFCKDATEYAIKMDNWNLISE